MVWIEDFMNTISRERATRLPDTFHRSREPLLSTLDGARRRQFGLQLGHDQACILKPNYTRYVTSDLFGIS
jgi:hypothetical protein